MTTASVPPGAPSEDDPGLRTSTGEPAAPEAPASNGAVHNGTVHLNGAASNGAVVNGGAPVAPDVAPRPYPGQGGRRGAKFSISTFRSLSDRNYRWYFVSMLGQFASMNMHMFIRGYIVFEMTGSYALLGVMSMANALPGMVFSLVGGVMADRVRSKKRLIQYCQLANMLNTGLIAGLIAAGVLEIWHLIACAIIQGTSMAIMMPARQALTSEVVGMDRLMNALALNSAGMNSSRLLMPTLAGGMMAAFSGGGGIHGAQYVYGLMAGLYLLSLLGLFKVKAPDRVASGVRRAGGRGRASLAEMIEGFRYIRSDRTVMMLILVNFIVVMGSMHYFQLLPGFARQVLGTGPAELGLLMSIQGIGSLVGSLVIASLPSRNRGALMLGASMVSGLALIVFAWSHWFWVSAAVLTVVGLGQSGRMSVSQVLIQTYSEEQYRGRVLSIHMMEMSLVNFATFFIALLAGAIGPQWAIGGTAAVMCAVLACIVLFMPAYRRLQ